MIMVNNDIRSLIVLSKVQMTLKKSSTSLISFQEISILRVSFLLMKKSRVFIVNAFQEDSRRQESLGVPDVNDHGSNGRTSSFGSSALVSPTDNSSMENSTMLRNRVNEQHDVIGNVSNNIAEKHIERINQHSGSFELDENGSRCDVPGTFLIVALIESRRFQLGVSGLK